MGKIKTLELAKAQSAALEKGYREGKSHAFRLRCQMLLLKCEQRSSAEVASILGCCEVVVNNWLKRFEIEGVEGLRTKPGRGRKPILDTVDMPRFSEQFLACLLDDLLMKPFVLHRGMISDPGMPPRIVPPFDIIEDAQLRLLILS